MRSTIAVILLIQIAAVHSDCTSQEASSQEQLKKLDAIKGKKFQFIYKDKLDKDNYLYEFSVCAEVDSTWKNAGIVQKKVDSNDFLKVVGRINNTSVKVGTDWIMLTYKSGDKYHSHCRQEARQAHIVIICNQNVDAANFAVLYEENSVSDCFYLMEMESRVACSTVSNGLSTGSILLIVGACLITAYLGIGMLYKRFVHGAKGAEQVPNIGFWRSCGNLQADGCDFFCRCQESGFDSSRPYRGIADEQLDDEADDENLLPM